MYDFSSSETLPDIGFRAEYASASKRSPFLFTAHEGVRLLRLPVLLFTEVFSRQNTDPLHG